MKEKIKQIGIMKEDPSYHISPVFNVTVKQLERGADELTIIQQLLEVIKNQDILIQKLKLETLKL